MTEQYQYAIQTSLCDREKNIWRIIALQLKHETALQVLLALKKDSENPGPRRGILYDHEIDAIETVSLTLPARGSL